MAPGATQQAPGGASPAAVIFDLDGVITDTAEYHYLGWKRLADEEGLPFDRAANERLRGVSRMESLELLLDGRSVPEEHKREWADRKNRYYVEFLERVTPADLLPGALETVLACKEQGLAVAIGSSSRNARTVLDRLEVTDLFDAISDGNSIERAKPAPDLFLHAAAQLEAEPARCIVFEDAESGVDAALAAGMTAVGIGPSERVGHATLRFDEVADVDLAAVVHPGGRPEQHLRNNVIVSSPWTVGERVLEPEQMLTTGSNYLIGNGFLGYRGTFPEWDSDQRVGCIVADTYDCADGHWTELCNAPNALYARWSAGGDPVEMDPGDLQDVTSYERHLGVRYGTHRRAWSHRNPTAGEVHLTDERFASYQDRHTIPMRQTLTPDAAVEVTLVTGIDGQVWNLHGDHFRSCDAASDGDELVMEAVTTEQGINLVVAQALRVHGAEPVSTRQWTQDRGVFRELVFLLNAGQQVVVETVMAVAHDADERARPRDAALASARASADLGYLRAKAAHVRHWDRRWKQLDVRIDGDPLAQALLRYNLYQAVIATPVHSDRLPIPARGLSSQAYQGGAFWDQEAFNLPMWLYTDPEQARSILTYRFNTLAGAQRKAASLGYEGAFYARVSGRTGDELCPSHFFTDVVSGRPIRNHFNDWQIHISPDISHAVGLYLRVTDDWDFIERHGAEMLFEVARFCASRVHLNPTRGYYEIIRVLGPDEYHENVDNNAFTNYAVRSALALAVECYEEMVERSPDRLADLVDQLALEPAELEAWRDVRDGVLLPEPDPESGLVEQFDGYCDLEDTTPDTLRTRLIDEGEYWGWPNGVAVETQVIKQADVVELLATHPQHFTRDQIAANYDYYAARTQHGSSLSPPTHAIVSSWLERRRDAYRWFLANISTDLGERATAVSGGTFIGGIRTGACGAAWHVVARGFLGLRATADGLALDPVLPEHWQRVTLTVIWRNQRVEIEAGPQQVALRSAPGNSGAVSVQVRGQHRSLGPGAHETVTADR